MNLSFVIGRTRNIMLDQTAAFKHGNLRKFFTYLHTHHVTTNGFTVALFSAATLNQFCVGTNYRIVTAAVGCLATIATSTLATTTVATLWFCFGIGSCGGWFCGCSSVGRGRTCVANLWLAHQCGVCGFWACHRAFARRIWKFYVLSGRNFNVLSDRNCSRWTRRLRLTNGSFNASFVAVAPATLAATSLFYSAWSSWRTWLTGLWCIALWLLGGRYPCAHFTHCACSFPVLDIAPTRQLCPHCAISSRSSASSSRNEVSHAGFESLSRDRPWEGQNALP